MVDIHSAPFQGLFFISTLYLWMCFIKETAVNSLVEKERSFLTFVREGSIKNAKECGFYSVIEQCKGQIMYRIQNGVKFYKIHRVL